MEITITDVHKRYGDVVALDGPTFSIPSGSTFGVLGTNGAGKTTLFELLVGHDEPDAGSIAVGGIDVAEAGHRVRERVAFLPEHAGFPAALTGREVLDVHARIRGLDARAEGGAVRVEGRSRGERIEECLELVGLTDAADRAVSGYSNGMGRRLGLAAALLADPPVLVLDEPTAGLDPRGVTSFHEIVERIDRETDATVVLSSHVLSEVERLCDEVAILEGGELRATGSIEALRTATDDRVRVVLHPADDRSALLAAVSDAGEVTASEGTADGEVTVGDGTADGEAIDVTTGDEVIEVACEREAAFDLLANLDRSLVDRFEVREPGLEAAFHEALAEDGSRAGTEVTAR